MKVRATRQGEYLKLREPGDVFVLIPREFPVVETVDRKDPATGAIISTPKCDHETKAPILKRDPITHNVVMRCLTVDEQFCDEWMEVVPENTPERSTSAPEALARTIAEMSNV